MREVTREILFRGKRKDGEWIYIRLNPQTMVWENLENWHDIIPSTVGQFTGVIKDDQKIFEGDIGWDCHNECYGVVEFQDGKFVYVWDNICNDLDDISVDVDIDFIDNIHDNPKLLD